MYLLKHAPLNKCTLIFTGNLDEVKRDLELLYELGVNKKVRQILVRRMEHTSISQSRLKKFSQASIDNSEACIQLLASVETFLTCLSCKTACAMSK